jgi:hypothetical protein
MFLIKKTVYKISNELLKFCSYSIQEQKHSHNCVYILEYTKGNVGDYNDWDCFISDSKIEVNDFEKKILNDFPDTFILQQPVSIFITICKNELIDIDVNDAILIKWIHHAIEHACFSSGLGVVMDLESEVNQVEHVFSFHTELNIFYSHKLVSILHHLITPWGVDFSKKPNLIEVVIKS